MGPQEGNASRGVLDCDIVDKKTLSEPCNLPVPHHMYYSLQYY